MAQCSFTPTLRENVRTRMMGSNGFNQHGLMKVGFDRSSGKSFNPMEPSVVGREASPLLLIAPGPTQIMRSSATVNWHNLLLEQHQTSPGERRPTEIDIHVITMICGRSPRLFYQFGNANPVRFDERVGSITFTPMGPVPLVRLESSAEFTHIAFQQSFIRGVIEEMEHRPIAAPAFRAGVRDVSIQRIVSLLIGELDTGGLSGKLYVDSLAHALATRYLLLDAGSRTAEVRTSPLPLRILNRVKEKIEANIDTDLSLDNLAKESGYSRAHFLRMFRAATGVTPHQFVLDLRLKQAQSRIKQTTDSLIDIAAECGFASQSHMTTVFRKYLDFTPAEVRRNSLA